MGGPMANNMTFQPELQELQAIIQTGPQKLYPEFELPAVKALTHEEKVEVKLFKEVQYAIMHETPFYIQTRDKAAGTIGDGIERYSDRWRPKRKASQTLTDLRTDEAYFPDELLTVLRGDVVGRKKRKQQTFDLSKFLDMNVEPDLDALDNSSIAGDGNDEGGRGSDDDEEEAAEDEAFSDEDGNDYEDNYFDDGDGDFEDVGGDEEAF